MLFETFGKSLRKHLRRSEADPIRIRFYTSQEVLEKKELLKISATLYEKMFSDKQMDVPFNSALAQRYAKHDALILAIAYTDADVPIGFKAVVHDELNARAWVTAFDFRNPDYNKQIIGRSHQRLYYEMLLQCKRIGISQFDFGGINSIDEPNGIAQFKMAFEGNPITYTNIVAPHTILGYMAIVAIQLKKKLRSLK